MRKIIRSTIDEFPTIANFARTIRDQLDRRDPPRTTPWGFKLAGNDNMASGCFEVVETQVVRRLLQDVDVLINIGANIGYYCCHALCLGKPVIAVEPIPRNLYYLMNNLRINGWANHAEVFPVALSSEPGILEMYGGQTGASLIKGWANIPESYVTLVPVLTLDRILHETADGIRTLILVDIEGAELGLLHGASRTLALQPSPIWMMEISSVEHQPTGVAFNPNFKKTFEVFFDNGYTAKMADEKMSEFQMDDINHYVNNKETLGTHNFIFKKSKS